MTLSKKHYEKIAKIVSNLNKEADKEGIVKVLCTYFKEDNQRFDADRFKVACGLGEHSEPRGDYNPLIESVESCNHLKQPSGVQKVEPL